MKRYYNPGNIIESARAEPPKGMKLCGSFPDLLTKLEQHDRSKLFRVTYGLEVYDDLTYSEACERLGEAILHALACNSKLDNSGR